MAIGIIIAGGVVVMIVVAIVFLLWGLKKALGLLLNSLIGFFALWVTQKLILPDLIINIWSVLITAVFGIVGYISVIILHFLGIF